MNRVSPGTMTVVIFAILVGLGGAFLVRQQMGQPQLPDLSDINLKGTQKTITVPVASVDLQKGRKLAIHDIVIHQFTPEQFAKSKFAGQPFMSNTNLIFERVVNSDIEKGSLFLPNDFYAEGFGPGVAERLQPGFRAVTVPIENVGAVTGFALPGSIVDVLFRSNPEGDRQEITMTLLEQVEVLALADNVMAGQKTDLASEGSVTLSVTPAQAKVLKVVEGRGEISLTLRNPEDDFQNFEFAPVNLNGRTVSNGRPTNGELLNFASMTSSSSSNSSSSGTNSGADLMGSMEMILDDASERVTMDDLLGISTNAKKKELAIYSGGAKTVLEFEEDVEESNHILHRGKRVQTPIAGRPRISRSKENVTMDYLP
ncbi:Flp pilus assembly protein CpaB [bacterium]|nr:Flp pilus assembly protein CpaB [bacterium]